MMSERNIIGGRTPQSASEKHMNDNSLVEIARRPNKEQASTAAYRVLYDGQCEICQACVSWLKTLDRKNTTVCLPISAEALPTVDFRLKMDECLRQLHVVTPEGEIRVGWDAVTCLARLFPAAWLIGVLGQRFPFRNAGRLVYGFVATNRYSLSKCRGGACHVAKPETVRRQAKLGAFWPCYTLGFFIRLPLVLWAAEGEGAVGGRCLHGKLLCDSQSRRGQPKMADQSRTADGTRHRCIRLLSLGHFSRTELIRSFVRKDDNELPTVYEVRMSGGE
jgi:predicted DCC family thiol-disulfide oxidoreductase YuxK